MSGFECPEFSGVTDSRSLGSHVHTRRPTATGQVAEPPPLQPDRNPYSMYIQNPDANAGYQTGIMASAS
eukprot:358534-Chlamydomonas_euryale.AAC.1